MRAKDLGILAASIIICWLPGIIGSIYTAPAITAWYAILEKPFFSPPNWLFAPAWSLLYTLMGISLYLFLSSKKTIGLRAKRIAIIVFSVQLILNLLWSILFFGFKNPGLAFVGIVFLWIFILASIILFLRASRPAAFLLIPYILWVSFAALLNYSVWVLNA